MIERYIENELTLKRWRRFKSRKVAVASSIGLLISILLTLAAPIIANKKPIMLSYKGETYFPVFKDYQASTFGITDSLVVNYRTLELGEGDSAVWPMIKWDPFESNENVDSYPSPPTSINLMGTDDRGRDVFTRLLYGFKYSISYAVLVWILSTILSIITGGIMGFFGGKIDMIGQRIVEVLSTTPQFFLLIILISIFEPTLMLLVLVTTLFHWIPMSYYVRGEFLKNRKQEYTEAAQGLGATNSRIIFKHILPNSLTPLITFAPFVISALIIQLASLDFLGFGLEVPTPSWGELLNQASKNYSVAWWLAAFPSACLFISLTMLNLIGEGIRDAMDPKLVD
jgi:microcin C transport system permease protein